MKLETKMVELRTLKPDKEGNWLRKNVDGSFAKEFWLGVDEKVEDYAEVTEDEAEGGGE